MVTFRFQNGVNIAKNVTTGSESYILAVFRAFEGEIMATTRETYEHSDLLDCRI